MSVLECGCVSTGVGVSGLKICQVVSVYNTKVVRLCIPEDVYLS